MQIEIKQKSSDIANKPIRWEEILIDSSKRLVDFGVSIVEKEPSLFPSLLEFALQQKGKYSPRAARVVYSLFERNPGIFDEYIDLILDRVGYISNESIKFCLLRVFTICKLPQDEDKLGLLIKLCFDAVEERTKGIALKVYAVEILYRIAQIFSEMKMELIYLIQKYMINSQPAFTSRGSMILRKLQKELGISEDGFV